MILVDLQLGEEVSSSSLRRWKSGNPIDSMEMRFSWEWMQREKKREWRMTKKTMFTSNKTSSSGLEDQGWQHQKRRSREEDKTMKKLLSPMFSCLSVKSYRSVGGILVYETQQRQHSVDSLSFCRVLLFSLQVLIIITKSTPLLFRSHSTPPSSLSHLLLVCLIFLFIIFCSYDIIILSPKVSTSISSKRVAWTKSYALSFMSILQISLPL